MDTEERSFWGRGRNSGRLTIFTSRLDNWIVFVATVVPIVVWIVVSALAHSRLGVGIGAILYGLHIVCWAGRWSQLMESRWFNPFGIEIPPPVFAVLFVFMGLFIVAS